MPMLSSLSQQAATRTSVKQPNKLRRRRRPTSLPLRSMDADTAHSADDSAPPTTAASVSPTLVGTALSKEDKDVLDDAQAQVIVSLRAQIQDLISQVTQLNAKLVKSYDRVSDLEDELHIASSSARANSLKISELEIERAQHLAALNTGLYVEKAHVTAELTRLMERATSEAAARGQAETARQNIETELDDLSANLFSQANSMVAEARLERALSERKVVDSEMALKSAEEAVGVMQLQMQALRDEKDRSADENARLRALVEKGKFVEHAPITSMAALRLLSSHAPYQEFLLFVAHLRSVRPSTVHPPHISTFLPLPFLSRLQTEDSDPTVRLDFAPSLNWLSRRSVLSAIHSGQLTIEPMSVSALLLETPSSLQSMMAGSQSALSCALCGAHLLPQPKSSEHTHPPSHPLSSLTRNTGNWSTSLFKNPLTNSISASAAPSPPLTPPLLSPSVPTTVYVFRLAQSHAPTNSNQAMSQKPTNYPLCSNGWCLTRMRATCSLWAFIRAGVIDRVWEEDVPASATHMAHAPSVSTASIYSVNSSITRLGSSTSISRSTPEKEKETEKEKAPPLPPRRRSKMSSMGVSVGSLWGMASNALKSQPVSPSHSSSNPKEEKDLPLPSPTALDTRITEHPGLKAPETPTPTAARKPPGEGLRVVTAPPPLPRRSTDRVHLSATRSNDSPLDSGEKGEINTPNEKTPVVQVKKLDAEEEVPPVPPVPSMPVSAMMTPALSKSSSGIGEEFLTPVEELNALSLANGVAGSGFGLNSPPSRSRSPTSPKSPKSPTSPSSPTTAKRTSVSAIGNVPVPIAPLSPRHSRSPSPRSPTQLQMQIQPQTPARSAKRRNSSTPPPASPRHVPLPDSRPGTPGTVGALRTHSRHGSVGSPLSTVGSSGGEGATLAGVLVNGNGSGNGIPERTASPSPAPPPVPRRAAARRAVPPPPPQHPGAPPPLPARANGDGDRSEEKEQEKEREDEEGHGRAGSNDEKEEEKEEEVKTKSLRTAPPPPLPPRHPEQVRMQREKSAAAVDASEAEDTEEADAMDEKQDRLRSGHGKEKGKKMAMDGQAYVGDGSWEERTWKEIVRLREDMFWARVGGVRV